MWGGWVDWLGGRDPLFRWLTDGAQAIFGPFGYDDFRLAALAVELVAAAWLGLHMPGTGGLVLVAALALGVTTQLREGLALIVALCSTTPLLTRGRGVFLALAGAVIAAMTHAAAVVFVALWLVAAALGSFGGRLWRALTVVSMLAAAGFAALVAFNADEVRLAVASMGVSVEAQPSGGVLKTLYWAAMSASVLVIRGELLAGASQTSRVAGGWLRALGCVALPMVLVFCLGLVLVQFSTPAVTTLAIRLLQLLMDAGLISAALRGRAGVRITSVGLFMLADAIRLLIGASA